MGKKEIVLGVSASIASYKACDIIRALKGEGYNVTAVMTRDAAQFITPLTLSALSHNKTYNEMFAEPAAWEIEHISLADKADLVLIAPATANIINKIACGLCDDLLSCTVLATEAPVLIAPAMDNNMYKNKITQDNIAKLKKLNFRFVGPETGKLATGKIGIGHLAAVEDIVKEAKKILLHLR
jgi:phosphopantothenoylcysteine decarboxylase/phosphopantothenate--cysteine ligase